METEMFKYLLFTIFIFMMVYFMDGALFLQRVLLIIFFDFDYVEKGRSWVKKAQDAVHRAIRRLKKNNEIKRKKEDEEANTIYMIEKEFED